jgi:hypothetical protein
MDQRRIAAAEVISQICTDLKYSRAHVAAMMRKNRKLLKARQARSGRWFIPEESALALRNIVVGHSGRRYKLGERGSRK